MRITPARRLQGRVSLPGDKSISHRAAIIATLANGTSRVTNFSRSQDCASTLSCLKRLGVSIKQFGDSLSIQRIGELRSPEVDLDCGNSGSTIRLLAGVLAGQNFSTTLTGDDSLRSRPMKRIIEPLQMMGAEVKSQDGKPPLTVNGRRSLRAIRYELPVASAQVKSCVLLAGLHAEGYTEVIERHGTTRDHTERMLQWFDVVVEKIVSDENGASAVSLTGPRSFAARDVSIPGDFSSAAFLIAAAALLPGSNLEIADVGLNPTRTRFLSLLLSLGFGIEITERREQCNEPVGRIRVKGGVVPATIQKTGPAQVRGHLIPELIDELPLLAVIGTQIPGGIAILDAGELRSKESDRISSTVNNLRAMGAEVQELEDGLVVAGPTPLRGASIDSYGDHRIAMAFSVAALLAEGESEIAGADCVSISFPQFFTLLDSVVQR